MNEFSVIQNDGIAALALHAFTKNYYEEKVKASGPDISIIMPVLPMVFNKRTVEALSDVKKYSRQRFLTVLSEHREIPVGLQGRMEKMVDQTFSGLNVAFKKGLLVFDSENTQLIPVRGAKTANFSYKENQNIILGAKLLGKWFANYPLDQICLSLNIHF